MTDLIMKVTARASSHSDELLGSLSPGQKLRSAQRELNLGQSTLQTLGDEMNPKIAAIYPILL